MGTAVGTPLSTRETVLGETAAASAMSRIVITARRTTDDAEGSIGPAASSGVDRELCAGGDIICNVSILLLRKDHGDNAALWLAHPDSPVRALLQGRGSCAWLSTVEP